jgi:hypothetical protein
LLIADRRADSTIASRAQPNRRVPASKAEAVN